MKTCFTIVLLGTAVLYTAAQQPASADKKAMPATTVVITVPPGAYSLVDKVDKNATGMSRINNHFTPAKDTVGLSTPNKHIVAPK